MNSVTKSLVMWVGLSNQIMCMSGKILENEHCVCKSFLSCLLCNNVDLYRTLCLQKFSFLSPL